MKFKAIGIAWKDNVVLQKSNKDDYFIPQVLDIEERDTDQKQHLRPLNGMKVKIILLV